MSSAAIPGDRRASIAVDLGAESCRVSLLRWLNDEPHITLVHRFPNAPVQRADGLRWPFTNIVAGVEDGIRRCAALAPEGIRSLAVDGWAVDYVRLGRSGEMLDEPFCYRDERTVLAEQQLHERITPERMREITGVQQLRLNTVYQLYADQLRGTPQTRWLTLPEYLLSRWGAAPVAEYTNATHTQLVDLQSRDWSGEIFKAAGLDIDCAPRLVPAGTSLGPLQGSLAMLPALRDTELIAPACHDTASAIAGIPALGNDWAYISSGTWSLVGTLVPQPLNGPAVRARNFTNLGAVGAATCFHKSVNGMWLLKQCVETWSQAGRTCDLDALLSAAEIQPLPEAMLDLDDSALLLPGSMPDRINAQRLRHGLRALDTARANAPAFAALILHSLSVRYAELLHSVQDLSGKDLKRIFVVGGGSRNRWLNRLTARTTGLQVHCGSAESSTMGNLAVQLATLECHYDAASPEFGNEVTHWAKALNPLQ